jgi:hypothetical protein
MFGDGNFLVYLYYDRFRSSIDHFVLLAARKMKEVVDEKTALHSVEEDQDGGGRGR